MAVPSDSPKAGILSVWRCEHKPLMVWQGAVVAAVGLLDLALKQFI